MSPKLSSLPLTMPPALVAGRAIAFVSKDTLTFIAPSEDNPSVFIGRKSASLYCVMFKGKLAVIEFKSIAPIYATLLFASLPSTTTLTFSAGEKFEITPVQKGNEAGLFAVLLQNT